MNEQKNFMNWDLVGKALITGASSGIGAAFARELAKQKFNLILVARRKERLDELASVLKNLYGIQVSVIVADLSKIEDIESLYSYISDLEDLDVLINNAGFGTRGYFENIPFKHQKDMIFVHNIAPSYFCRAVLPNMIMRNRGVIINTSSMAAITHLPQNVMYNATKAFLKVFTETLHLEIEGTDVKVQALCPGFTITEFHEVGDFQGFNRKVLPEKMWMSAEEVANLSLEAISKDKIVFIPGGANEAFAKLWNDPKLGEKTRKNMTYALKIPRKKK